jgi:hypothetical protein
MADQRERLHAIGRTRSVLVCAIAAIVCDALVTAMAYGDWRTYASADKNAYRVAGDDPDFFVTNFVYAAVSSVRYLVLAGLVVALLRWNAGERRRDGTAAASSDFRLRLPIAGVVGALEAIYLAATWADAHPSGSWCLFRIMTGVLSAVAAAAAFMTVPLSRRSGDAPSGHSNVPNPCG